MSLRRGFRGVSSGRVCRLEGCGATVEAGAAYCRAHAEEPEAVAFRRELAGAATYFDMAVETLDPDQVERAEAFQRFKLRAARGEFDGLLEASTRRMMKQAAAVEGFELELGALRYGLMRVLAEETDPTRMALALARLSNAGVRARLAGQALAGKTGAAGDDGDGTLGDRLAAAMMGYDVTGRAFTTTWDGGKALAAMKRREAEWAAAWAERARAEEAWEGSLAALRAREAEQKEAWAARRAVEAGGAEDTAADETSAENRRDADHAGRIAAERSAAVRRWEAERATVADTAGWEDEPPEPRVARGGR